MFETATKIEGKSFVKEIVSGDHRTASVLKKYGIEYCCGGNWPLDLICETKGLDTAQVVDELRMASRTVFVPNSVRYSEWKTDFLVDYIVNVHHNYLTKTLPVVQSGLEEFTEEHAKENPELVSIVKAFKQMADELLPHLEEEEKFIFPYIRQVAHAYEEKDAFASLFVRTLRKPLDSFMQKEHTNTTRQLNKMRDLTNNYQAPEDSCLQHRVVFSMLKEIDNDLVQHVYLENDVLFPRVIEMEKELLK